MGIVANIRQDFAGFGAADVLVGVVLGVIGRVYMIFGSPIINVVLHGMGPLGDTFYACTFMPILLIILLVAGTIRVNGLTFFVAAETMTVIRFITGDPFSVVVIQAYTVSGILTWLIMAALNYKLDFGRLVIYGWVFSFFDGIFFFIFWGVYPIFGSESLGWIKVLILDLIILQGTITGIGTWWLTKQLAKIESLKTTFRTRS